MAGRVFGDSCLDDGFMNGALHEGFVHVVSSLFSGFWVFPTVRLGEDPLPYPVGRSVGVFAFKCARKRDGTPSVSKVACMNRLDMFQLVTEGGFEHLGQHGHPVLVALPAADEDFTPVKVDILNPERHAFHEPEPGSVHESCREAFRAAHAGEYRFHFIPAHDDRQAFSLFCADYPVKLVGRYTEHPLVVKEYRGKCLVLGRRADVVVHGERADKAVDLFFVRLCGRVPSGRFQESGKP